MLYFFHYKILAYNDNLWMQLEIFSQLQKFYFLGKANFKIRVIIHIFFLNSVEMFTDQKILLINIITVVNYNS